MKYNEEIEYYSKTYNVDGALIASISNAESSFNESARSAKGALGIMQLMPSTAQWVAQKIGIDYKEEFLYDANYNLQIGSYYLSYLIENFGDKKLAICAYNAGPANVKSWLKNKQYSADGINLDKIPFAETENYLNKVNKNYRYYSHKYN